MKEIKAIVRRIMADGVVDGLRELGLLPGLTVSTVTGFGRLHRDAGDAEGSDEAQMTKIEMVVTDSLVDEVVAAIARAARTGREGDGKIFVYDVTDVVKIRTGERGEPAI